MSEKRAAAPVYLVGAGFSKAVSSEMPLMIELSELITERGFEPAQELAYFGGDFESWLSFLATHQPWLSDAENLRHEADFFDASQMIQELIIESEKRAIADAIPIWLIRLMRYMSEQHAAVATFNYDTFLERSAVVIGSAGGCNDLYPVPLPERKMPGAPLRLGRDPTDDPRITLYKLHGSINWYSRSLTRHTSSEVYLAADTITWDQELSVVPPAEYGDLGPVVIPPVAAKNLFYASETLRAQWNRAAAAVSRADALTVIGYSFPPSDWQTRALFSSRLRRDAEVTVVDRNECVAERIRDIFDNGERSIELVCGDAAVSKLVESVAPHFVEWHPNQSPETGVFDPLVYVDDERVYVDDAELVGSLQDLSSGGPETKLNAYIESRWPGVTATMRASSRRGVHGSCGFVD